jgi:hypothetical protein
LLFAFVICSQEKIEFITLMIRVKDGSGALLSAAFLAGDKSKEQPDTP